MSSPAYERFESEVLALYAPPHRRRATWFKMRKVLAEFAVVPGVRLAKDLTPLSVTRWLEAHSDRAPMTNKSYLSAMRAACNYAKRMGYLKVTPWEVRRDWITFDALEDHEPATPRHLGLAEIGRLLALLDAEAAAGDWPQWRLQALVYTYLHTGLRKCEALGLRLEDVHLDRGLVRLRPHSKRKLKTRTSARLVGIPADLGAVLGRWIPRVGPGCEWLFPGVRRTKPWFHGPVGRKPLDEVKAAGERAGVPHVTIHALRRSLATAAKGLGLGPLELRDLLGHDSPRTQEWYLEPDAEVARRLASRIRFPRPRDESDQGPPAAGAA